MKDDMIHYELVNAETDNVIAYLSLAMTNGLFFEAIYWLDPDHAV